MPATVSLYSQTQNARDVDLTNFPALAFVRRYKPEVALALPLLVVAAGSLVMIGIDRINPVATNAITDLLIGVVAVTLPGAVTLHVFPDVFRHLIARADRLNHSSPSV